MFSWFFIFGRRLVKQSIATILLCCFLRELFLRTDMSVYLIPCSQRYIATVFLLNFMQLIELGTSCILRENHISIPKAQFVTTLKSKLRLSIEVFRYYSFLTCQSDFALHNFGWLWDKCCVLEFVGPLSFLFRFSLAVNPYLLIDGQSTSEWSSCWVERSQKYGAVLELNSGNHTGGWTAKPSNIEGVHLGWIHLTTKGDVDL